MRSATLVHMEEHRRVPAWVICHGVTRTVSGGMLACAQRGRVDAATCLDCRFLTASSFERTRGDWCDADPAVTPDGTPDSIGTGA